MLRVRKYTKLLSVRISDLQYKWLLSKAKRNNCNIADVTRDILNEAMKNELKNSNEVVIEG